MSAHWDAATGGAAEPVSAQHDVADAVKARGYWAGWTAEQIVARQVAKLQEELGELALWVDFPGDFVVDDAGRVARRAFDDLDGWGDAGLTSVECESDSIDNIKSELADIVVVALNMAAALEELGGVPWDVVEAAREKATRDVKRGVRGAPQEGETT